MIPDRIVQRAVVAKGQVKDHGGIGASMRAALEAVYADLLQHAADEANGKTPGFWERDR